MKKLLVLLLSFGLMFKETMKVKMFSPISKQLQVFRSIVLFVFSRTDRIFNSFVVNNLAKLNIAIKNFFHYKTRPRNITISVGKRMIRVLDKNITVLRSSHSSFPIPMVFPSNIFQNIHSFFVFIPRSKVFFERLRTTLNRTKLSNIFSVRMNIKLLFARKTNLFNLFFFIPRNHIFRKSTKSISIHNILQIKNTLFRELLKARFVFSPLLSVFDYRQKKSALSTTVISIALLFLLSSNVYSADQWDKTEPAGSTNASDLDSAIGTNNEATDRLLINYQEGAKIEYASSSTITVALGQVACANSAESVVRWRRNTSDTTVSWASLDTGAEASSTTYYLWAVADTDVTTFTVTISTSSTAPSGKTYFLKLGSFYNDSSSNIQATSITNDNDDNFEEAISDYIYDSGWFAISTTTTYAKTHSLGTTKLLIKVYFATDSSGSNMTEANMDITGTDSRGGKIAAITTSSVSLMTLETLAYSVYTSHSASTAASYARIIIIALE